MNRIITTFALVAACGGVEPGPDRADVDAGTIEAADSGPDVAPDGATSTPDASEADATADASIDAAPPDAMSACDPLDDSDPLCAEGANACYLAGGDPVCVSRGLNPIGAPCAAANDCVATVGCYEVDGDARCRAYCDFIAYPFAHDPDRCTAGQLCASITGHDAVGACI